MTLKLIPLIAVTVLLQACGSNEPREASGSQALNQLGRGACPPSIVDGKGRGSTGKYRYGRSLDEKELQSLRSQELGNCQTLVNSGDKDALSTLVRYWDEQQRPRQLVGILEQYVAVGNDPQALGNSGAYLYRAYSHGGRGTSRDQDKAFKYLALAVNNGVQSLELSYARELHRRGLDKDALRYFRNVAKTSRNADDRCEARLSMAELYFSASGELENWNLGYYYWMEGLVVAKSPQWGSCAKDNFVYGERYSDETERKRFVEQRMSMMSAAQKQVIDEARSNPRKGEKFVASLSFNRPSGAPSRPDYDRTAVTVSSGWGPWQPVQASICRSAPVAYPQSWSSVFEANSEAIWTVDSHNGASRSQGSAVAIAPRELITNCHLIENPANITLRRVGWNLPATLKAADRQGDRCVLATRSDLPGYVQSGKRHQHIRVGEDVATISNPQGLETSLSRGIVAQKRARDGLQLIQTDAAISSGSSGGGLFDKFGNLVGITTFSVSTGQSLNFAIAIDEFCQ
jgi:serine protease Do